MKPSPDRFVRMREAMVLDQIEMRGIRDARVLAAMREVPRHLFVPDDLWAEAYNDYPLPIGQGQTISQPYIVALMTELLCGGRDVLPGRDQTAEKREAKSESSGLSAFSSQFSDFCSRSPHDALPGRDQKAEIREVKSESSRLSAFSSQFSDLCSRPRSFSGFCFRPLTRVLEVGTGCGYQAAVLSLLAHEVYTIEFVENLAVSAADRLKSLGYPNVNVKAGDGSLGWPEAAPFDGIIVTAAAPRLPDVLVTQLTDGGRLVIPEGGEHETQILRLYEKKGSHLSHRDVDSVRFVPMRGAVEQ